MDFIAVLLILDGLFGIWASTKAFGDIGMACLIGGIAAMLSGIAVFIASHRIRKIENSRK